MSLKDGLSACKYFPNLKVKKVHDIRKKNPYPKLSTSLLALGQKEQYYRSHSSLAAQICCWNKTNWPCFLNNPFHILLLNKFLRWKGRIIVKHRAKSFAKAKIQIIFLLSPLQSNYLRPVSLKDDRNAYFDRFQGLCSKVTSKWN